VTAETPARLTVAADLAVLPGLLWYVAGQARAAGLGRERVLELELAVEEVLTNIIKFAYPDRPGEVSAACRQLEDQALEVTIIDQGRPFNPLTAPGPVIEAEADDRPVGGLGILLARKLTDQVTYRRQEDRNVLVLVKSNRPVTD